jgi:hypothetical protein
MRNKVPSIKFGYSPAHEQYFSYRHRSLINSELNPSSILSEQFCLDLFRRRCILTNRLANGCARYHRSCRKGSPITAIMDFKGLLGASDAGGGLASSAGASAMGMEGSCPSLSLKTRVIAFGVCFGVGMILSFMSTISLWSGNLTQFAVMYTFGNILAMAR